MVNMFAEYQDRYFYYRDEGYSHREAKQKAINEMIAFGIIKDEKEIWREREKYRREQCLKNSHRL